MKKIIFFTIVAFVLQLFCDSVFGQAYNINGNPINFNVGGVNSLQMKSGMNDDFTIFLPRDFLGTKWNRIIAENQLSITTGGRGKDKQESDLFITTVMSYLKSRKNVLTLRPIAVPLKSQKVL